MLRAHCGAGQRFMGTLPLTAPIAVLGSGSWGTALAIQFARAGKPTRLWGRDAAQLRDMRSERRNRRYLPDAPFPELLQVADSLEARWPAPAMC